MRVTPLNIPAFVARSYDPHSHKTKDDLAWLIRHELDLYEEDEETDMTPRDARAARLWLKQNAPSLVSA